MARLGFNRICNIEDFAHSDLVDVIRDVFARYLPVRDAGYPRGFEENKIWEVAMAVRALREFGALRPDAVILGVAAGLEDTSFYLSNLVAQVFATDRYAGSREWDHYAPATLLTSLESVAPPFCNLQRLVVQHMDGRRLRYPDETFDGVYSSSSIEHFGEFDDVAQAAFEMGRVLKPGGVLAISTEAFVSGPPGHTGWPHATLVLSREHLERYIVEASGLELVDDLDLLVTQATEATTRHLHDLLQTAGRIRWYGDDGFPTPEYRALFPQGLLENDGVRFGSVHLTLRKPTRASAAVNGWARPTEQTSEAIRAFNAAILSTEVPPVLLSTDLPRRVGLLGRARGTDAAPLGDTGFTRFCEIDDFSDPEMVAWMTRVCAHRATIRRPGYPHRYESAEDWSLAMSARAIAQHQAGGRGARVLVMGGGTSPLIFHLTHTVRQVFAADEYLGEPGTRAPRSMLVEPSLSAPYAFDDQRLVVQAMPMTSLRYPDATFDAVVMPACGATTPEVAGIARAAAEIGRVLRPGGLALMSLPVRLSGGERAVAEDGPQPLLSRADIDRYVIEAGCFTPVPDRPIEPSARTMATRRPWADARTLAARLDSGAPLPPGSHPLRQLFPQIVFEQGGATFTTLHLALERRA